MASSHWSPPPRRRFHRFLPLTGGAAAALPLVSAGQEPVPADGAPGLEPDHHDLEATRAHRIVLRVRRQKRDALPEGGRAEEALAREAEADEAGDDLALHLLFCMYTCVYVGRSLSQPELACASES